MFNWEELDNSLQLPSPIQKIDHPICARHQVELWIKREDLIHPTISGNKWRKLKGHLIHAQKQNKSSIVTFGGAFSNHIHATAAACQLLNISCAGIIRGEEVDLNNPTLKDAISFGMHISRISRSEYRQKAEATYIDQLHRKMPHAYLIPEGGSGQHALLGCQEIMVELMEQISFKPTTVVCSIGTGTSFAGLISAGYADVKLIGINALKNPSVETEVSKLVDVNSMDHVEYWHNEHRGGYAKVDPELIQWINEFNGNFHVPLDPIYTGKALMALLSKIEMGYFKDGSSIVFIHTGGLQGIRGHNLRYGNNSSLQIDS